ncbi:ATP phosphoribosyltransferase regulatory subunit, partial [Candidatus Saccharibacteria bacterium]|nr:ATP phosphoribosyltransferase regulatory subunit [Candidatus Saccharibacteria bacterium]
AEQELILVVRDILRTLGANDSMFRFRLNNRKLMDSALKGFLGFEDNQLPKISRLIDAKAKLTEEDFLSGIRDCLDDQQLSQGLDRRLWDLLSIQELAGLPEELKQSDGYQELAELLDLLELAGVTNALFDVCIMRGFDYYTGNVFEAFDNNPDNPRSMFGGGRYDGLVGAFGVEPLPTVGFGMGDVTLREFLSGNNLLPAFQPVTQVYVALVGDTYRHALPIAQKLREQAVNVAIDFSGRKLAKQLEAASKKGINWVLFIGDAELESGQLKLKNMQTGEEICNDVDHLIDSIKNR